MEMNVDRVNFNLCMDFYNVGVNEWIGFCFEMIGVVVFCSFVLFFVILFFNYV